jgi:hypothetical protein
MTHRLPCNPTSDQTRRMRVAGLALSIGASLVILAAPSPAAAQNAPGLPSAEQRVDHRQDRQAHRIDQGVASGELTRAEARRLGREQAGIARGEARAEGDGVLTRREARRLEHRQDVASRHIARQKHDRTARP